MIIDLITLGLIILVATLIKKAKKEIAIRNYLTVIFSGFVVLIFKPLIKVVLDFNGSEGAIPTAISLASTIFGIYCIIWGIAKLIKFKKVKS